MTDRNIREETIDGNYILLGLSLLDLLNVLSLLINIVVTNAENTQDVVVVTSSSLELSQDGCDVVVATGGSLDGVSSSRGEDLGLELERRDCKHSDK